MAKFNLKEHIAKNKATFFGSLTEGQFSWFTQDTDQQIGSEPENTLPFVYMHDNKGNKWLEKDYEGYGVFGGKDYYELLDQMNGGDGDRERGIDLAFDKEAVEAGKVLFPALTVSSTLPSYHSFNEAPKDDPNQSWYTPEEDDYYDQNDDDDYYSNRYGDEDEEELDEIKEIKPTTKMKKSELKAKIKEMVLAEYERDVDYTDETAGYDFLAELEGMLDEADETEKDTAEAEDVTIDDTETIDTETTTEVDPNVKAVQDALTQAQAAAQKLGDPKLTDQIGNTITFFTRAHVVEKGAVAEGEEVEEASLPIAPGDSDYDIGYKAFFVYEDKIGGFGIEDIKKAGKIIANKVKNDNKIQNTDEFFKGFMDSWNESGYDETADKEDMYESKKPVNEGKFKIGDMLQTYGGEEEVTVIGIKPNLAAALADTENPKAVRLLKQNLRQDLIDDEDKNKPFYLVSSDSFPEDMYYVESELESSINEVMFPMLNKILK